MNYGKQSHLCRVEIRKIDAVNNIKQPKSCLETKITTNNFENCSVVLNNFEIFQTTNNFEQLLEVVLTCCIPCWEFIAISISIMIAIEDMDLADCEIRPLSDNESTVYALNSRNPSCPIFAAFTRALIQDRNIHVKAIHIDGEKTNKICDILSRDEVNFSSKVDFTKVVANVAIKVFYKSHYLM